MLEFKGYSMQVKQKINDAIVAWLYEAAGELEAQVKRKTRVDFGDLKKSWKHEVREHSGEAYIGSSLENAIWEEFGTGEYALKGNGRKTPWYVPVDGYVGKKKPTYDGKVVIVHGKNGKKFYKTNGKRGTGAFMNAYTFLKPKLMKSAQDKFKRLK